VEEIKSDDPTRERIFEFLQAWFTYHGSKPMKLRELDSRVCAVLGGSRQKLATFVRNLKGARGGGFVVTVTKPQGKWGATEYAVHHDEGRLSD
jgi:hypothetical protein